MTPPRLATLAILLLALAVPAPASAHAQLEGTSPPAGAALKRAPATVTLRFDEAVETAFGALRVTTTDGERVDDGRLRRPGGNGAALTVALRRGLGVGTYIATYDVLSDDGHPVSGTFAFRVGAGSTAAVASAPKASGPRTGVRQASDLNHTGGYLALALGLGTLLFLVLCWMPALREASGPEPRWRDAADAFAARWRTLWLCSVALGAITAALGVVLEGATAARITFAAALQPSVIHEVLSTHAGQTWVARLLAWVLVATAVEAAGRHSHAVPRIRYAALGADGFAVAGPSRSAIIAISAAAGLLVVTPALGGHAAVQSPVAALLPLDIVHVAAMCAWLGGLMSVALLVPAAGRHLDSGERARLLAAALTRFSPIALGAVFMLAATGVAQAALHLHRLDALTATAYGRAIVIKVALLAALIALGALNRQRTLPRLQAVAAGSQAPGRAARTLRATVAGEIALLMAVLTMTGVLVSSAPPAAHSAGGGPVELHASTSMDDLQVGVAPARRGVNHIDLYADRSVDGLPDKDMYDARITATPPGTGKSVTFAARVQSPGHFVIPTAPLTTAGSWTLQISAKMAGMPPASAVVRVEIR